MESRQGSRYYHRVSRDTDIYISGYVREMEKCNFKLCRRNNKSGNGKVNCNGGSLARGRVTFGSVENWSQFWLGVSQISGWCLNISQAGWESMTPMEHMDLRWTFGDESIMPQLLHPSPGRFLNRSILAINTPNRHPRRFFLLRSCV